MPCRKPTKPYPSFPLTVHNNGQWCKKIRGKIHFFGVWEDPDAALDAYLRVANGLHAGRKPRMSTISGDGLSVKVAANEYLTHQHRRAEVGGDQRAVVRRLPDHRRRFRLRGRVEACSRHAESARRAGREAGTAPRMPNLLVRLIRERYHQVRSTPANQGALMIPRTVPSLLFIYTDWPEGGHGRDGARTVLP